MTKQITPIRNNSTYQIVLPLNLGYKIPKDDELLSFCEIIEGIEIEKYVDIGKRLGRKPINKVAIMKIILFGFMNDIRSTRKLEKACKTDIRFMYLLEGEKAPSHTTIQKVISSLSSKIEKLFIEIVEKNKKRKEKGLEKLSRKAKIQIEDKHIKYLENIEYKLLLKMEILNIKLVNGKGKRKNEIQKLYEEVKSYKERLSGYKENLKIMGDGRNSYSKTDKDATFMRMKDDHMKNGQLKAGYSIQAAVSNEYIVAVDLYDNRSDQKTYIPFMKKYKELYGFYSKYPVADAGYGSYDNYFFNNKNNIELYQKYTMFSKEKERKYKEDPFRANNLKKDDDGNYICPNNRKLKYKNSYRSNTYKYPNKLKVYECETCENCDLKKDCTKSKENRKIIDNSVLNYFHKKVRENLNSEKGIQLRIQRSIQVEGAFGVIKENMKYRRFTRTNHQFVKLELLLVCIGYNLKKFHNKLGRYPQLLL